MVICRFVLTIQCELTKFVKTYPLPDKETVTVARTVVHNFISRYRYLYKFYSIYRNINVEFFYRW